LAAQRVVHVKPTRPPRGLQLSGQSRSQDNPACALFGPLSHKQNPCLDPHLVGALVLAGRAAGHPPGCDDANRLGYLPVARPLASP
jgi:hypothetical protein